MLLKGKNALEELLSDKLSNDEVTDESKEDLVKLLTDHFERPEEPKKRGGRFGGGRRNSKKSPDSTRSESKLSESEEKTSPESPPESPESPVSPDIIPNENLLVSVQNQNNAVTVN